MRGRSRAESRIMLRLLQSNGTALFTVPLQFLFDFRQDCLDIERHGGAAALGAFQTLFQCGKFGLIGVDFGCCDFGGTSVMVHQVSAIVP